MITFFRRLIGSKLGALLALIFLGLIAFAFAAGDVSSTGGFGSITSFGGSGTKIGSQSLSESELQTRTQRVFEQQRRDNPGMKIGEFLSLGAVPQIYDQLVAGITLNEFARQQGVFVSKRMIDARIAEIPAFHDAAGKFSQELFRQMLSAQGVSEKALREDISKELTGQMIVGAAGFGTKLPDSMVLPYASLLLEARSGRIAAIPSVAFLPKDKPTDAQLKKFYTDNAERYTVPEQRSLRYAVVDTERFAQAAVPSDAEIKAYYDKNKAKYAAKEKRNIEQLILPTESAAKEAASAASLDAAAKASGLSVATFEAKTKEAFAADTSKAAADAVFAAPQGQMAGPVKLALGWAIFRTTAIDTIVEKTLDAAKPEIAEALKTEKQGRLLSDFIAKVDDDIANGATFDEVVKDNGLKTETTPLLLSTGQNVQDTDYRPSSDVGAILKPGFDMENDDDPQFAPIIQQQRYALVDVADIAAAAPPPLEKIKPVVLQQYALSEGAKKAKALAAKLKQEVDKGKPLDKALADAGTRLPPIQNVSGRRADLLRGDQRPPAEISILFAMAPGTAKTMPIPNDQGMFIIMLDDIQEGDAAKVPGLVDKVRGDITNVVSSEYADQLERAIERNLGVQPNPALVGKVTQELRRINGAGAQ